jgi:hypothetical protein
MQRRKMEGDFMVLSLLDDKSKKPGSAEAIDILGPMGGLWKELQARITEEFSPIMEEWVFSGKNYGWSMRLKQKKRAVLYMTPCPGHLRVSYAFGEKAVQEARRSNLPASVLKGIEEAQVFMEGRAVRLEVRNDDDVLLAVKLAHIKMTK